MDDLFLGIECAILGGSGAWLIYRWGKVLGLIDRSNDRSSHEGVVPKGGGVGILAAFVFASLFLKMPLAFWIPATFLALFSLLGDKVEISPKYRLPIQFIMALSFLFSAHALHFDPLFLPQFNFRPLSSVIYFFFLSVFMVGTANWYNFMDGINGIAAITGIVGFSLLASFNIFFGGDSRFSLLSICIALSCLSFLPFNMPKAKVFMGDVGSILLGFVFAGMVVLISKELLDFICLASFLFPFYADELTTMAIRIRDKENLIRPHRRHFYQLLANEMGIDHWKVSIGYGVFQLLVGASILLARPFGAKPVIILLIFFFIGFIWANYIVRRKIATSF